jgi:hypothetical protein
MDMQEKKDLIYNHGLGVVPDTLITTKDGFKEIKDIIVGDEVLSDQGVYKKVLKVFKYPNLFDEKIVKIKYNDVLNNTPRQLHIARSHEIFVEDFGIGQTQWKKARQIALWDFLLYISFERDRILKFYIDSLSVYKYSGDLYNLELEPSNIWYIANNLLVRCRQNN